MHFSIARNAAFVPFIMVNRLCKSHISLMSICKFYLSNLNKELKVEAANARELALMQTVVCLLLVQPFPEIFCMVLSLSWLRSVCISFLFFMILSV
jgi:hypothetical protein